MNLDISLPSAISKIINTKWSKINDFHVYFIFPAKAKNNDEKTNSKFSDTMINIALKSITLPAMTQQSLEVYTGGMWMTANGRPDLARVECTFRDYDDFILYRAFVDLYERSLGNFKDECYIQLTVATGVPDAGSNIAYFNDLLIENVSQISFDNTTEDQIAEFSVTMRGTRAQVKDTLFYKTVGSGLIPAKV